MEEPARAVVLCLSALTCLARVDVLGDVAVSDVPAIRSGHVRIYSEMSS